MTPETSEAHLGKSSGRGSEVADDGKQVIAHKRPDERKVKIWIMALLPLALHLLLTIFLTSFALAYVHKRLFGLTSRRQSIPQPDGTTIRTPYMPLQTDIVTLISSCIALSRIFGGMWTGAMAWRCAFVLLEKGGAPLEDVKDLLSFQLLFSPSSKPKGADANMGGGSVRTLVFLILLLAFPSQFTGPLMTGSITWTSSHSLLPPTTLSFQTGTSTIIYSTPATDFVDDALVALSLQFSIKSTQNSNAETHALKRVVPDLHGLPVNSRVANLSVAYFSVKKIEWIKSPLQELGDARIREIKLAANNETRTLPTQGNVRVPVPVPFFIPDNWPARSLENQDYEPFSRTRSLLAVWIGRRAQTTVSDYTADIPPSDCMNDYIGALPPEVNIFTWNGQCYLLARIDYDCGSSPCGEDGCAISANSVVQNQTSLQGEEETTINALAVNYLLPNTALQMLRLNVSAPFPYGNLDGYVSELLLRSYSAIWSTIKATRTSQIDSIISLPVEGSRAFVAIWRVLLWSLLNILVTMSGVAFVLVQMRCLEGIVADPGLTALLIDSTPILHRENRALCDFKSLESADQKVGLLRLRRDAAGHRRLEGL